MGSGSAATDTTSAVCPSQPRADGYVGCSEPAHRLAGVPWRQRRGSAIEIHVEEPWPHMPAQRWRCRRPEGQTIRLCPDDARTRPVELARPSAARGPSPRRPHGRVRHVRHPASRPPDGGRRRPGLRRCPLVLQGREGVHGPLDLPPGQAGSRGRGTNDTNGTARTAGNAVVQNARRMARRRIRHRIAG